MKTKLTRYILTIALLLEVWQHSHWSVALAITLIALAFEWQDRGLKALGTVLRELSGGW